MTPVPFKSEAPGQRVMLREDCEAAHGPILEALRRIETLVSELHHTIYTGNGAPPMTVRLDRVEGHVAATRKAIWAVLTALLGGLGLWIWTRLRLG